MLSSAGERVISNSRDLDCARRTRVPFYSMSTAIAAAELVLRHVPIGSFGFAPASSQPIMPFGRAAGGQRRSVGGTRTVHAKLLQQTASRTCGTVIELVSRAALFTAVRYP